MRGNAAGFGPGQFGVVSQKHRGAHQREGCAQAWPFADRQPVVNGLGLLVAALELKGQQAAMSGSGAQEAAESGALIGVLHASDCRMVAESRS